MSTPTKVSIIVPTLEGEISRLREALSKQTFKDWELVVEQAVRPAARARNQGAARAQGEWLVFVDDDVRFNHDRVLEQVVQLLEQSAPEDAVNVLWELSPEANWVQRAQVDMHFRPSTKGKVETLSWKDAGTACFALRRSAFKAVGGFDDSLISGEDCELAYRLHLKGGQILAPTDCRVVHEPADTLLGAFKKTLWYEWGNAQVMLKHPESHYRIGFRGPIHIVVYLAARTIALIPLWFIRMSYHHRKPSLTFRPIQACLSYVGAWAYGLSWWKHSGVRS